LTQPRTASHPILRRSRRLVWQTQRSQRQPRPLREY
jgi:hypothetical protein